MKKIEDILQQRQAVAVDCCLLTDGIADADLTRLEHADVRVPARVRIYIDHDTPSGSVAVAAKQKRLRTFSQKWQLAYEYGSGIAYHRLMEGPLLAGDVVAACGRHVATVGASGALGIPVVGETMAGLLAGDTLDLSRFTVRRLALHGTFDVFTSAKDLALSLLVQYDWHGVIAVLYGPQLTWAERVVVCNLMAAEAASVVFLTDIPAQLDERVDLGALRPMAVLPGDFTRIVPATAIDGIRVNQVFIGGCAGGTIDGLRQAAQWFKGRKVSPYVRVLVAPVTAAVYVQALDEGLIDVFLDAGVLIMNQGCSACWAQSQGRCDSNEVFVTTGCINAVHWAGAANNGIYIESVASAAKAALTGFLYEN